MFLNTSERDIQPIAAGFTGKIDTYRIMGRLFGRSAGRAKRLAAVAMCLCAPAMLAQTYVPGAIATGSTSLYTSAAVISPGRVAVDKAGNVYFIAVGASSSSLMEVVAATETGVNAAPVTLITGLGATNARSVVVDTLGNLWASTGSQVTAGSDSVALVEIPAANGVPNTALAGSSGVTLATADAAHCTLAGTAICTVLNSKLNDLASVISGPQVLDFSITAAGLITYIDVADTNLPSGDVRIATSNVYSGSGTVLATLTAKDSAAQVAVDGAGNTYYCSPASAKVSLVAGGVLTTAGTSASLSFAVISAPTGVSSDIFGNLYISSLTQLSEVPFEVAALNFTDEFGIVSALTSTISAGGALDQNGNYYYAYNGASSTKIQEMQIGGYNFGQVGIGSTLTSATTPAAPSLNIFVNVMPPAGGVVSYFVTGSPTTNTTAQYLQSFPYSGTKSFSYGATFAPATNNTITFNFQPIHPGVLKGGFGPRSLASAYPNDNIMTINLQGIGAGPEPLLIPGTPSVVFSASTSAALNAPQGLAIDSYGDIFVADTANGKVVADCLSTTVDNEAGTGGSTANTFCSQSSAATQKITQLGTSFVSPVGIAIDGAESVYVLDSAVTGVPVTLLDGLSGAATSLIKSTTKFGSALLSGPMGIAVDGYANVYIADTGNNRIVEAHQFDVNAGATGTNNIVYVPSTTTFGGTALSGPTGIAVDGLQNLFIADTGNNRIVEYSHTGVASVIATGSITLSSPYSVTVYPSGQLVVTDKTNGVVLVDGTSSQVLSFSTTYTTTGAKGVTLDSMGNIYLANTTGNQVLELNVTSPPTITFANTNIGTNSSNATETVFNEGNAPLIFSGLASSSTNFSIVSSGTCTATGTVAVGGFCSLITDFTPLAGGPLTGSITLTDNQLSYTLNTGTSNETATFGTNGTQALNLSGFSISGTTPQTITFPAPASPIAYTTAPITLSATSTSGLAVVFSVVSGPGTISGNALTVTGLGTVVIKASQFGNVTYAVATPVTQSIVVNQASQTISFGLAPTATITYSTSATALTATSSSGQTVVFSLVSGGSIASISGSSLTTIGLGQIVVAANVAASTLYTAAPTVTATITIGPIGTVATPVLSLVSGTYNASWFNNAPGPPKLIITDSTVYMPPAPAPAVAATIYYTTDGSTPTTNSPMYVAASYPTGLSITSSQTVRAIAVLPPGYANSPVASGTYVIDTTAEDLTYTLAPTTLMLKRGTSGTINISVAPVNGINATITFGCTGLPIGASCSFSPATANTAPVQAPVSTVLTVTAPTILAENHAPSTSLLPGATIALALCLWGWRRRGRLQIGLLLAAVAFCLTTFSGCSNSAPSTESYPITVSIAGDAVRYTPTFTLIVQ